MTNARIEKIFAKTKLLCFGRYVLLGPQDASLSFGADFPTLPNQAQNLKQVMEAQRTKILAQHKTAEVNYFGTGPAPNTALIRSYANKFAKQLALETFDVYYVVGPHIFVGGDSTDLGVTPKSITEDAVIIARDLRVRATDEVPIEQGICHEYGFTRRDGAIGQSLSSAGLYMPALPDITFSVLSNQNASTEGSNGHGLLRQIADQRKELGRDYPKLKTLREGKKLVHGWAGEESLVRRQDGTHDFEWKFIGESRNVARPALLDVTMFSKVKANRIGAADAASLNDEEAMALWDKLLDGLKFRVAVPGAPDSAVAIKG